LYIKFYYTVLRYFFHRMQDILFFISLQLQILLCLFVNKGSWNCCHDFSTPYKKIRQSLFTTHESKYPEIKKYISIPISNVLSQFVHLNISPVHFCSVLFCSDFYHIFQPIKFIQKSEQQPEQRIKKIDDPNVPKFKNAIHA
jgi:hypothetical protein